MNIKEFNSPAPKPWLNPNFNNVSCNGGLTFIKNANYALKAVDLNRIKLINSIAPTTFFVLYDTAPLSSTARTGSVVFGRDAGSFGSGAIDYIYNGTDRSIPNAGANLNAVTLGHTGGANVTGAQLFSDGSFYIGAPAIPKYKFNSGGKTGNDGLDIVHTTESTSTTTGCLILRGGVGIAKNLNVGGLINDLTVGGGAFAQTNTVTVANTIVETSLMGTGVGSLTVFANRFTVGGSYIVESGGVMSCLNNAQLIIRIYGGVSGLTLLGTLPTLIVPVSTSKWWGVTMYFTVRTLGIAGIAALSSRATYNQNVDVGNNLFGSSFHVINNTTFDTTIDNTLRITAEWGAASASNTISQAQCVLTKSY